MKKVFKSIKLTEASYNELHALQCLLFQKKRIKVNKGCLMNFLISNFRKSLENSVRFEENTN